MTTRMISGTELHVSPIALGTALFGATIDTPTSYALLDAFVERGGNFIDTARSYNDWIPGERGRSEGLIGRWMLERRNRSALVIATKGGHAAGDGTSRLNGREIAADVDASLQRLNIERIDLYYVHRDDPSTPVATVIDALNSHMRAGTIRYIACSNWKAHRIREANDYASASGQVGFVANQPMWNAAVIDPATLPDRTLAVMDADMWRMHADSGLACVPYSSQAGGLFTKMSSSLWSLRYRFGNGPAGYPFAPNQKRHREIAAIATAKSLTIAQVTLGYLLSQPFVTVPVVGCRSLDQLHSTMSAADVRLDTADLAAIDAAGVTSVREFPSR